MPKPKLRALKFQFFFSTFQKLGLGCIDESSFIGSLEFSLVVWNPLSKSVYDVYDFLMEYLLVIVWWNIYYSFFDGILNRDIF